MELLFTEEALQGSKHKFTTSLSSRLVAVPQNNVLPIERGEILCAALVGWLVRFFKRYAVPLEDWLRPLFLALGDGNHSGNRRGGLGQAASRQWDLVRTTPFALVDVQKNSRSQLQSSAHR